MGKQTTFFGVTKITFFRANKIPSFMGKQNNFLHRRKTQSFQGQKSTFFQGNQIPSFMGKLNNFLRVQTQHLPSLTNK